MERITLEEFDLHHDIGELTEEEFDRLADRALDLTEELSFGRADGNEKEARRAMKEMISYWIDCGNGQERIKSESVGNYSVTRETLPQPTLHGIPVSPSALLILSRAGLRNPIV